MDHLCFMIIDKEQHILYIIWKGATCNRYMHTVHFPYSPDKQEIIRQQYCCIDATVTVHTADAAICWLHLTLIIFFFLFS